MKDYEQDESLESNNFYSQRRRSQLLEEDEIAAWEEAFMRGWDNSV